MKQPHNLRVGDIIRFNDLFELRQPPDQRQEFIIVSIVNEEGIGHIEVTTKDGKPSFSRRIWLEDKCIWEVVTSLKEDTEIIL